MTPDQIALALVAARAAAHALTQLLAMLKEEDLTDEQKTSIRSQHAQVQAATERLTPIPPPPA